jgi:hypothetical protein
MSGRENNCGPEGGEEAGGGAAERGAGGNGSKERVSICSRRE